MIRGVFRILKDPSVPVPDGGWRSLLVALAVVAGLFSTALWTLTALVLPRMGSTCSPDPGVATCSSAESNLVAEALRESLWPAVNGTASGLFTVVLIFAGVGVAVFVDTSGPWGRIAGAPSFTGFLAGLGGSGVGILVAGFGHTHPLAVGGLTVGGVAVVGIVVVCARWGVRRLRDDYAVHLRRRALRRDGTRVVGVVTAVEWMSHGVGDNHVFKVTTSFRTASGLQTRTALLATPKPLAPVLGGTVLVYCDDTGGHPTGIDLLLDIDPDSIRDPDADAYPDPSPS